MSPPDAHRPSGGTEDRAEISDGDVIGNNDSHHRQASPAWLAAHGIDPEAVDEASDADRAYFDEHPDEVERVRLALVGEFGPYVSWVRVRVLGPGLRARIPWMAA